MRLLKGFLAPWPLVLVTSLLLMVPAGLSAGAWGWTRGWVLLGVSAIMSMGGSAALAVLRPASFAVRRQGPVARPEKRQPWIDAAGLIVFFGYSMAWFAFLPVDALRLRLLAPVPLGLSIAGLVMVVGGMAVAQVAVGQNQFAAPSIHDQSDAGQRVIDSGLYGLVRHPFYAGMLLVYPGAALWLGSYAGAIGAVGFLLFTLARIVIEERWLRANLTGYDAYARRVRGRLVPGLL